MEHQLRFAINIFRSWNFNFWLHQRYSLRTFLPLKQKVLYSTSYKKVGPVVLKELGKSQKSKFPIKASKIIVIENDGSVIGEMHKDEAKRFAEDRNMKLVFVPPASSEDVLENYKLMTGVQLHEERIQTRKQAHADSSENKTLVITDRITTHDLQTRIKSVQKWLTKNIGVKVTVTGKSGADKKDSIAAVIEESTQGQGKLINKRTLEQNTLKFFLQPMKKK